LEHELVLLIEPHQYVVKFNMLIFNQLNSC
jgi:hypothetical protein